MFTLICYSLIFLTILIPIIKLLTNFIKKCLIKRKKKWEKKFDFNFIWEEKYSNLQKIIKKQMTNTNKQNKQIISIFLKLNNPEKYTGMYNGIFYFEGERKDLETFSGFYNNNFYWFGKIL